jgi:hypothetical protein
VNGQPCDPGVGCGPGVAGTAADFCDKTQGGTPVCRICGPYDTMPLCSGLSAHDAGASAACGLPDASSNCAVCCSDYPSQALAWWSTVTACGCGDAGHPGPCADVCSTEICGDGFLVSRSQCHACLVETCGLGDCGSVDCRDFVSCTTSYCE